MGGKREHEERHAHGTRPQKVLPFSSISIQFTWFFFPPLALATVTRRRPLTPAPPPCVCVCDCVRVPVECRLPR